MMQSTVLLRPKHRPQQLRIPSGSGDKRMQCHLLVIKQTIEMPVRRAQAPQPYFIPPLWMSALAKYSAAQAKTQATAAENSFRKR